MKRFVQTIREVQTLGDGSGNIERSAGYDHAWSWGDVSYILSNGPNSDPSAVFLDQRWKQMKRPR